MVLGIDVSKLETSCIKRDDRVKSPPSSSLSSKQRDRKGFLFGNDTDVLSDPFYRPPILHKRLREIGISFDDFTWDKADEIQAVVETALKKLSFDGRPKFKLICSRCLTENAGISFQEQGEGWLLKIRLASSSRWAFSVKKKWKLRWKFLPYIVKTEDVYPLPIGGSFSYREAPLTTYTLRPIRAYWTMSYEAGTIKDCILDCILNFEKHFLMNFDWLNRHVHPHDGLWRYQPETISKYKFRGRHYLYSSKRSPRLSSRGYGFEEAI
jgi:hypothetical protein